MRWRFGFVNQARALALRAMRVVGWCSLAGTVVAAGFVALIWQLFPVPVAKLENWPSSPVVTDRDGRTLAKLVGHDDQWRMPVSTDSISPWLVQATVAAEDARFWEHPGIDGWAVLRALHQNVTSGRVVSGASTLSMQVCRMLDDQPRTLFSKFVDGVRAVQLEQQRSKSQIVEDYLNVAPYGGNIRGVEAAALLYFNKHARDLSLGEAALLAGIPQQPSRLRPDLHLERSLKRRDYVLSRMTELGMISNDLAQTARSLPVEIRRHRSDGVSSVAAFALQRRTQGGQLALDSALQSMIEEAVVERRQKLPPGSDVSVVVIDIATGELRALVGSADATDPVDGQINGFIARRSPGSALKPFVYAAAFESRRLVPESVVVDDPQQFADWTPENFDRDFAGRLTVGEALRASRNIPAIHVAQGLGLDRCLGVMEACGLNMPADAHRRGGLTLAVGGIEVTLLDLTNAYATLGRNGHYMPTKLYLDGDSSVGRAMLDEANRGLSSDVCATINDILSSRRRQPVGVEAAARCPWFMWKTGTSSGRRDAWAVGHNHRFAIGVWVGKFSGVGHHDFVGKEAAEPLLARLFCHATLRNDRDPPAPGTWVVTNPLPLPDIANKPPVLTSPMTGEVFVAVDGRTVIHPRVNRDLGASHWFLNDRFLGADRPERLELSTGSYELRCVTPTGQVLASRFRVE